MPEASGTFYMESVMAFGVVTGALHRWVYLPFAARRRARLEREREDDLFLHGDDGVRDVRPAVRSAATRLAHVEQGVEDIKRGQAVLLNAAKALLTDPGGANGVTREAVAAIKAEEDRDAG